MSNLLFFEKSNYRKILKLDLSNYTEYSIFLQCLRWILLGKYDLAYRLCCRYNSEKPISPGINCNWKEKFYNGISNNLEKYSKYLISKSDDRCLSACALYSFYSGASIWTASRFLINFKEKYNYPELQNDLKYINSLLSDFYTFNSYNECGIENYRFLATLDEKTCPICGKLDGQIFLIKEKQIGINCPPMHKGCRCTTVSGDHNIFQDSAKRFARDSNGRGIEVPASMNWTIWKKQYGKN